MAPARDICILSFKKAPLRDQNPKGVGAAPGPSSPHGATDQCDYWALCRGIFGFCHHSRSTPLIAVNYFGINGDVLRTSTINEASRMSTPANISWWREMGKYMVVEEEGWEHNGGEVGNVREGT